MRNIVIGLAVGLALGAWSARSVHAEECTAILQDGTGTYSMTGTMPDGTKEACFSFTVPKGTQVVATVARAYRLLMRVYVSRPGDADDRLAGVGGARFSTEDRDATLVPAWTEGPRHYRILVTNPIASAHRPYGIRVSLNDKADACVPILRDGAGEFKMAMPAPDALHGPCWLFTVPAGSHVTAEASPGRSMLLEASARAVGDGLYIPLELPATRISNTDTSGWMRYADTGKAAKQFLLTMFANPDVPETGGQVSVSVTVSR